MENNCDNLSLYIIDELSKHEKSQFENHLKTCIACKNEVDSLQETWQLLSFDFEEEDVPESLKAEVMDFIFEKIETPIPQKVNNKNLHFLNRFKLFLTKQFSPLSTGIMTILAIGLIGLLLSNFQLKDANTALENNDASPAQIVRTFDLKGQNIAASANGSAYLLQEGRNTSLIIELNNMPRTKNDEVYQVWLLKNGKRQNAGTLKPDQNGNGMITYRIPKSHSFDDIGITLEPNPDNTQPSGQKVMGSS